MVLTNFKVGIIFTKKLMGVLRINDIEFFSQYLKGKFLEFFFSFNFLDLLGNITF
jgi:hypothetical protein